MRPLEWEGLVVTRHQEEQGKQINTCTHMHTRVHAHTPSTLSIRSDQARGLSVPSREPATWREAGACHSVSSADGPGAPAARLFLALSLLFLGVGHGGQGALRTALPLWERFHYFLIHPQVLASAFRALLGRLVLFSPLRLSLCCMGTFGRAASLRFSRHRVRDEQQLGPRAQECPRLLSPNVCGSGR